MNRKPKTKAERKLRTWKTTKALLHIGTYLSPFVPASILTAVNVDEWFATNAVSVSTGFVTLALAVVMGIFAISKKDNLLKTHVSPIIYIAIFFVVLGVSFKFLESISGELGNMFILIAVGLVGSFASSQVEQTIATEKTEYWKSIVVDAGIDRKASEKEIKRKQEIELAIKEAHNIGGILE